MSHRETMLRLSSSVNLTDTQKLMVARVALAAVHSSGGFSAANRKSEFEDVTITGAAWDLLVAALNATASCDTHRNGEDAPSAAEFMGSAVPKADAQPPSNEVPNEH